MLTDCLIGLVWIVILLLPAIVASRQPVVSHNGYLDSYMNTSAQDGTSQSAVGSSTEL